MPRRRLGGRAPRWPSNGPLWVVGARRARAGSGGGPSVRGDLRRRAAARARTRPARRSPLVNGCAVLTILVGTPLAGLAFELPGEGALAFAVIGASSPRRSALVATGSRWTARPGRWRPSAFCCVRSRRTTSTALHAIHSDEAVARWLYNDPRTLEETRELLAHKIAGASLRGEGEWLSAAAVLRGAGELVGDVSLLWASEAHRQGELGFVVHPDHQGKGYATEAARPMLGFAFETLGLHRVVGRLEPRNTGSARVLEKLGMRREAHLVENEWVKGEWQSELVYAILAREWRDASAGGEPRRRPILTPSHTTEDHDMALSFGVTVLPDPPASRLVELMKLGEDNGFEIGWTYDSHVPLAGVVPAAHAGDPGDLDDEVRAPRHEPGNARADRAGEPLRDAARHLRRPDGDGDRPGRLGAALHRSAAGQGRRVRAAAADDQAVHERRRRSTGTTRTSSSSGCGRSCPRSRCGSRATARRRSASPGRVGDGVIIQLADPEIIQWIMGDGARGGRGGGARSRRRSSASSARRATSARSRTGASRRAGSPRWSRTT